MLNAIWSSLAAQPRAVSAARGTPHLSNALRVFGREVRSRTVTWPPPAAERAVSRESPVSTGAMRSTRNETATTTGKEAGATIGV
jgi:hypothetical protein